MVEHGLHSEVEFLVLKLKVLLWNPQYPLTKLCCKQITTEKLKPPANPNATPEFRVEGPSSLEDLENQHSRK